MNNKKEPVLISGNEVMVLAAKAAGVKAFFGYPITPASEGCHLAMEIIPVARQAESEAAAGFMMYGAAIAGERVFTITSGPGLVWMQDAISYMACVELPGVFVNVMRGGPALGNIQPSQSDYWQAVYGGGNGDYQTIVLAPSSVQELADLTILAFDLADTWRNPVVILSDGYLGQMEEPVVLPDQIGNLPPKLWKLDGCKGREPRQMVPFDIGTEGLEEINKTLQKKYARIVQTEQRHEEINIEGAEILVVAFGMMGRTMEEVVEEAAKEGIRVGLVRPVTLWPFPRRAVREATRTAKQVLVVEMNCGQMETDVCLALGPHCHNHTLQQPEVTEPEVSFKGPVHFYGRSSGIVPGVREILEQIRVIVGR